MAETVIALTGGIGSGKSTAGKILREKGYCVLDADVISREIVMPGSHALERIVREFGKSVLQPDGSLNRRALAAIVFSDEEKRKRLNAIMHPAIADKLFEQAAACADRVAFAEVPLLTEPGFAERFDRVWCVTAPREVRLKRAAARDGCTPEEILRRMAGQPEQERLAAMADEVLHNGGTPEELERQIDGLLEKLQGA